MYTRTYSSRYSDKTYSGENTAPQPTEPISENLSISVGSCAPTEKTDTSITHSEQAHPQTEKSQETSDISDFPKQAEEASASAPIDVKRKRAIKTFRVRSAPNSAPSIENATEIAERDEVKSEAFDVTRNGENAEKEDPCHSDSKKKPLLIPDTNCAADIDAFSACENENNLHDEFLRSPQKRRSSHKPEKNCEKSFFPSSAFGLKNLSYEDIFLCAILLLLINEGCEDIMILILGFLLLS